jgi:glycine cleavage system aminomethyltransferase T
MRIEKGHVAGGELNGQSTALNMGLGKMVSKKKDSIGMVLSPARGDDQSETAIAWWVSSRSTRRQADRGQPFP